MRGKNKKNKFVHSEQGKYNCVQMTTFTYTKCIHLSHSSAVQQNKISIIILQ